jgi:hypothetical protein
MKDLEIYSKIFDITSENMQKANHSFTVSKDAYLHLSADNPQSVDVFKLSEEDSNEKYLEKAYISFLKRLSDETAYKNWSGRFSLPKHEFQRLLTITMINATEFNNTQVRAYNNIYSQRNAFGGNVSNVQKSNGMNMPDKLLKFYRNQPEFMKKIERKIMGIK